MENNNTYRHFVSTSTNDDSLPSRARLAGIFNKIVTSRLILRRLRSEDGPAMFAVHGDPATNRHNPAGPHPDLATSEQMLRECLQHWEAYGFGYWAVTLLQEETILGFGGVEHLVWCHRDVLNLYYRFTPRAWGHGYATELAQIAIKLAQEYLPQWPVIARTRSENIASIRTAERAGLVRHSDLDTEQHIVFALGWTPIDDSGNSL